MNALSWILHSLLAGVLVAAVPAQSLLGSDERETPSKDSPAAQSRPVPSAEPGSPEIAAGAGSGPFVATILVLVNPEASPAQASLKSRATDGSDLSVDL